MRVGGGSLSERQRSSILMMLSLCFNQNNQGWNDLWYDGHLVSGNKHELRKGLRILKWHPEICIRNVSSGRDWRNKQVVEEIVNDNTTDYPLFSYQFYSKNYIVSRKVFYCIIRSRDHSALGFAAQSLARLFILKLLFEFQKGMNFISRISILDFIEGSLVTLLSPGRCWRTKDDLKMLEFTFWSRLERTGEDWRGVWCCGVLWCAVVCLNCNLWALTTGACADLANFGCISTGVLIHIGYAVISVWVDGRPGLAGNIRWTFTEI